MPVGAHEQVARIVGIQIQQNEARLTAVDDERLLVGALGTLAEGAVALTCDLVLSAALIRRPMRVPQALEAVGRARQLKLVEDL